MHISLGTMHPGGRDKIPTSGKEPRDPLKAHLFKTAAASGRRYEERRAGPWFRVATTASRGQAVYCDRPSHSCVSRPSSDQATTTSRDRTQTEPLLRLETELEVQPGDDGAENALTTTHGSSLDPMTAQ